MQFFTVAFLEDFWCYSEMWWMKSRCESRKSMIMCSNAAYIVSLISLLWGYELIIVWPKSSGSNSRLELWTVPGASIEAIQYIKYQYFREVTNHWLQTFHFEPPHFLLHRFNYAHWHWLQLFIGSPEKRETRPRSWIFCIPNINKCWEQTFSCRSLISVDWAA